MPAYSGDTSVLSAIGFQLGVDLAHEPFARHAGLLNLRVEVGGHLCGHDLVSALSLIPQTRDAVANHHRGVAMRDDRSAIHCRAVAGNDLRIRTRASDDQAEPVEQ